MEKKSYAVFGLGRFGRSVAEELAKSGAEVLAVDMDEEKVRDVAEYVTFAVTADVCDIESMEALGLRNMDGVIVAITENLNASVLITILAKEMGVPYVIAKAKDNLHIKVLEKVGADKVIIPEKESGVRVARSIWAGNFIDFIELSDRVKLIEIPVRDEWIGKTLRELNLRQKNRINIVAIREDGELSVGPDPDKPIKKDISMIVTVDRNDISQLTN